MITPHDVATAKQTLGAQLAAARQAAGLRQEDLKAKAFCSRSTIANIESGRQVSTRDFWVRCDALLHADGALIRAYQQFREVEQEYRRQSANEIAASAADKINHMLERSTEITVAAPSASGETDSGKISTDREIHHGPDHMPDLYHAELVRQGLDDALSDGAMAEASLDDWELTVLRHGRATRDRPAGLVLEDLSADLAELKRAIHRHRSSSALQRLTRAAAQMSGLMCLTLCKLDERSAFRLWARTARLAADEAGDPQTQSWILAQEAYGHFYSTDLPDAIDVAQHAQAVVAAMPCVGAALAAALEARAHAAMGNSQQTRAALGRAEYILSHLEGDALIPRVRLQRGSASVPRGQRLYAPGRYTRGFHGTGSCTEIVRSRRLHRLGHDSPGSGKLPNEERRGHRSPEIRVPDAERLK